MKKLFYIFLIIFFPFLSFSATYYVVNPGGGCADNNSASATVDGSDYDPATGLCGAGGSSYYSTIADLNAKDFADNDIIDFKGNGDSFTDASLALTAVTSPSGKDITLQSHLNSSSLPIVGGNGYAVVIVKTGLNLVMKDLNLDGQEISYFCKLGLNGLNNITLDNLEMDGSVDYDTDCTPNVDCKEKFGIYITGTTGAVEIQNSDIRNWGGDEDLWSGNGPAKTDADRPCISMISISSGTISIHDNTIVNCESDGLIFEQVDPTSVTIYDNTIQNGGENSIDIKGSSNFTIYRNTLDRTSGFVGCGGSSTGETEQPIINILSATPVNGRSEDIEIYHNNIGPTDMANIQIVLTTGTDPNTNINIHHNYFEKAFIHLKDWSGTGNSGTEVVIWANIFEDLRNGGLFFISYGPSIPATKMKIYSNVFYVNTDYTSPAEEDALFIIYDDNSSDCQVGEIINNAFYINDATDYILWLDTYSSPTINHNVWWNANGSAPDIIKDGATGYDLSEQAAWRAAGHTDAVFADPKFFDATNEDLPDFSPDVANSSPLHNGGNSTLGETYDDGWTQTSAIPPSAVSTLDRDAEGTDWDIGAIEVDDEATAPATSGHSPANLATGVSRTGNIVVVISDANSGVDRNTIQMDIQINDGGYSNFCCTDMVGTCPSSGTKALLCTGQASSWTVTKQNNSWTYDDEIDVLVDANDRADTPNTMTQDSYSFTVESDAQPPDPEAQFSIGSGNKDITIGGGSQTIIIQ